MASDVFKYVLIGGAAYVIYEMFFATPAAVAAVTTPVTTSTPVTATAAPTGPVAPLITTDSVATQTSKLLAAAGGGSPMLNASEWNYYYNQAYNSSATWLLGDDGSPMAISDYMALRVSKGFSGLGAIARRGKAVRPMPVPRILLQRYKPGQGYRN